ncbi:MAG: polymerase subunit sigma [Firmicutes bacterium]|nr:polymerase subunit sigma [Bacillota bacterium]
MQTADQLLVKLAREGDQDAFAQLVQLYQRPIYNLAFRMTGNPEDAEELTQTAFLNAWRGLGRFQEDATFFTWLYRLATNACIDFLRHEKRRFTVLQTVSLDDEERQTAAYLPDYKNAPEERALQRDLHETLSKAMQALSHEHREILIQREIDGLSYQEIAELLDLELGTVKSRIARARLALRRILEAQGNYFERSASEEAKASKGGGHA